MELGSLPPLVLLVAVSIAVARHYTSTRRPGDAWSELARAFLLGVPGAVLLWMAIWATEELRWALDRRFTWAPLHLPGHVAVALTAYLGFVLLIVVRRLARFGRLDAAESQDTPGRE